MSYLGDTDWPVPTPSPQSNILFLAPGPGIGPSSREYDFAVPRIPNSVENHVAHADVFILNLYEGPEKCSCCINWVEKQPVQMPESEKERYDSAAICVYRKKHHFKEGPQPARFGGLISLQYDRIVLQSKLLISLVRPVFAIVKVTIPERGHVEFLYPFRELYISYEKLTKLPEEYPQFSHECKLLRLLAHALESIFAETFVAIARFHSKKTISYQYLWTLFPKGMILYREWRGIDTLVRVTGTSEEVVKGDRGLNIHFQAIEFNGADFGVASQKCFIRGFDGERSITSLEVYPANFYPRADLPQVCEDRGRQLLSLQSVACYDYEGFASSATDHKERDLVTGRVIVDPYRFCEAYPDCVNKIEPFTGDIDSELMLYDDTGLMVSLRERQDVSSTVSATWTHPISHQRASPAVQEVNKMFFATRPYLLMLVTPCVQGFSLKYNRWFNLELSRLREIQWTPKPLDGLVLQSSIKQTLSSCVTYHINSKGYINFPRSAATKGLLVLLVGSPGTGKTTTAEAVAEETKLPLCRITGSEWRLEPGTTDCKLAALLELASEWKCIVLLEDVDIFLPKWKSSDRIAHEMVPDFLRHLECYQGTIFMTTRKPEDVDEALLSRCRLHIPLPEPDSNARLIIWNMQFNKAGLLPPSNYNQSAPSTKLSLQPDEWHILVNQPLNGREIHNVVQNTVLWCRADNVNVTYERLKIMMEMTISPIKSMRHIARNTDEGNSPDGEVEDDRPRKIPRLIVGGHPPPRT